MYIVDNLLCCLIVSMPLFNLYYELLLYIDNIFKKPIYSVFINCAKIRFVYFESKNSFNTVADPEVTHVGGGNFKNIHSSKVYNYPPPPIVSTTNTIYIEISVVIINTLYV